MGSGIPVHNVFTSQMTYLSKFKSKIGQERILSRKSPGHVFEVFFRDLRLLPEI